MQSFVIFTSMGKYKILQNPPAPGDKTSHLQQVIEFLIQQGNVPVDGKFKWDKSGIGTYLFKKPIDVKVLVKAFDFPKSIRVSHEPVLGRGIIFDRQYALKIH